MAEVEAIAKLTNQLSKLPGIGRKTAQRLAYHIVGMDEERVRELAVAIFEGKKKGASLPRVRQLYRRGKVPHLRGRFAAAGHRLRRARSARRQRL